MSEGRRVKELEGENALEEGLGRAGARNRGTQGDQRKKMVSASARIEQARYAMKRGLSERASCTLVQAPRSMLRYEPHRPSRDAPLRAQIRRLAMRHRRFGYRRLAARLRREGEPVNVKRVHRLCKAEGLSVARRRTRRRVVRPVPMPSHDGAPNVV
jgi:putative transposase